VRPTARNGPLARTADVLVWLGGGSRLDIDEHAERSSYQTAGCVVALNALLAATVVQQLAAQIGASPLPRVVLVLVTGVLVGALGRGLATANVSPGTSRTRRGAGEAARALVAVLLGLVLGEAAAVVVFAGAVDAELLVQRNAAAAAVVEGPPALDLNALRADRGTLDAQVAAATARRDQALVVARCEYRPGPGCPTTRITGDAGRGPETAAAQADLSAAEQNLNAVVARRDQLDQSVAGARGEQTQDQSVARALAGANTGLDARWSAMNTYSLRSGGPLPLRLGLDALAALLLLLPLLLRWWRGQTEQDHELLSRALRRRAERDAETAIALSRSRQRVALEAEVAPLPVELASAGLASAGLASAGSDSAGLDSAGLDSAGLERSATGRPIETTALPRPALVSGPLVSVSGVSDSRASNDEDASEQGKELELHRRRDDADRDRAPAPRTPLDLLPGPLPSAVRTISGLMRPLVPGPVARIAAATGPRSVRIARGLWEEVEEFQITIRGQRTVRVVQDEYAEQPGEPNPDLARATGEIDRPERPRTWADAEVITDPPRRSRHRPVDSSGARGELPVAEMDERRAEVVHRPTK
jgi:hypothetical protein